MLMPVVATNCWVDLNAKRDAFFPERSCCRVQDHFFVRSECGAQKIERQENRERCWPEVSFGGALSRVVELTRVANGLRVAGKQNVSPNRICSVEYRIEPAFGNKRVAFYLDCRNLDSF